MKKWIGSVLLVCLVAGSFLSGAAVLPAQGASGMKSGTQVSKSVHKPVHDMIVFNDYQVAGLDANGWNWVKNDEFILPPETPLDIDLIQTTYGKNGTNVNRKEVFLDGVELTAFQGETSTGQNVLRWQVPRFTIPPTQLGAGVHTLTFVVTDAVGQSSTVNVRFQVEAQNYPLVYEGEKTQGESVPSGDTVEIFGLYGSKSFASNVSGTWRLTNKVTGAEIKTLSGHVFLTGTLVGGQYDLQFTPDDGNLVPWKATVQVGLAELYMGTDASGQKLAQNQVITAPQAPSTVPLYSTAAGRWSVNGTGQTLSNSQNLEVIIPESLAGMTISVTFEPQQDEGTMSKGGRASSTVQIRIPGTPSACASPSGAADMDVLMQRNKGSSLMVEREQLFSSDVTVKLYQNPIYKIWLATSADHVKYGSEADDDEGPGVWAVDNVVVDSSKLNWDHTALDLSSYSPGRHKINFFSKRDPVQSWCGYVQVLEEDPPISSYPVCDPGETGEVPQMLPVRIVTKTGKEYENGAQIVVDSAKDLDELEELSLIANHAVMKGTKKNCSE